MALSWARVRAVFWKDTLELKKNLGLLASMLALPAVVVLVPLGVVYSYVRRPLDPNLEVLAKFYDRTVTAHDTLPFLLEKTLLDWFAIYLILPVFVPMLLSSHAVAGEKEKRTLEPLLASPITAVELVIGKSLASLAPALAVSWAAFALLCIGVDLLTWPVLGRALMPNATWLFGVLALAPLFAFFGNGVAVLISARTGDARFAQQLSGLFVLPLAGLGAAQFAGALRAGPWSYLALGLFVLALDVLVLLLAPRMFDRERLISRWG